MVIMTAIQSILHNLEELTVIVPYNSIRFSQEFEEVFCFEKAEKLRKLQLNFSFNDFIAEAVQPIFKNITSGPNIEEFNFSLESLKISHVHFNKGIKELKRLTKLKKFTLNGSNNTIREEGIFGICDILAEFQLLEELELILRQYRSCYVDPKSATKDFQN